MDQPAVMPRPVSQLGRRPTAPMPRPFSPRGRCSHRALAAMGRRNGGLPAGSHPREHTRRASAANRDGNGTRLAGTRPRGCPPRAVRCQGRAAIPSYESFTCGQRGCMATVRSALPGEQGEQGPLCQGRGVAHVSRHVALLSPKVARFDSSVARDDVLSSPHPRILLVVKQCWSRRSSTSCRLGAGMRRERIDATSAQMQEHPEDNAFAEFWAAPWKRPRATSSASALPTWTCRS